MNFTSAERELHDLISTLDQSRIKGQVAHDAHQTISFMAKWVDNLPPGLLNPRNRWRFTEDLITKFWTRLIKEYLSTWTLEADGLRSNATQLPPMWSRWWIRATHEGIGLWVEFKRFFLALTGRTELYVL